MEALWGDVMTVTLVCDVCGSTNFTSERQRSIDDRWPMAHCRDHTDRPQWWTPLISAEAFHKRQRIAQVPPMDLFGGLSEEELAALKRPLNVRLP